MPPLGKIRQTFLEAADFLGINHQNTDLTLRREHLEIHRENLAPLFTPTYLDKIRDKGPDDPLPKTERYLKQALSVPLVTVTNLNVKPGEKHFVLWLCISSYFPLISACLAPLGNLISLIGLIEHWRVSLTNNQLESEGTAPHILNIIAFVVGIIGNISLLMNFTGVLRYFITQSVSIFCWIVAASMLIVAVILTNASVIGENPHYKRSQGFWLAVWTIFMYYMCSIVQAINFAGYKLKKYPASYNLDRQQRHLINYTMGFAIWQAIGAVVMKHLIPHIGYGASLYYCVVSLFTVGLGDIHPLSTGAKVFALIFSFVGIINVGMIVTMLMKVVIHSAGPSVFWHHVEEQRMKLQKRLDENSNDPVFSDSFSLMRDVREGIKRRQFRYNAFTSLLLFLTFWLCGAAVFYAAEDWSYFNAVYFCFLCLLTIGYGDFAPKSAFGRAFFIQWAMCAVPLMTIIISTCSDFAFNFSSRIDVAVSIFLSLISGDKAPIDSEEEPTLTGIPPPPLPPRSCNSHLNKILADLEVLESIAFDVLEDPTKEYSGEEWAALLRRLRSDFSPKDFSWLEDSSPLRLPLKEPSFLLISIILRMRRDAQHLVQRETEQNTLTSITSTSANVKSTP